MKKILIILFTSLLMLTGCSKPNIDDISDEGIDVVETGEPEQTDSVETRSISEDAISEYLSNEQEFMFKIAPMAVEDDYDFSINGDFNKCDGKAIAFAENDTIKSAITGEDIDMADYNGKDYMIVYLAFDSYTYEDTYPVFKAVDNFSTAFNIPTLYVLAEIEDAMSAEDLYAILENKPAGDIIAKRSGGRYSEENKLPNIFYEFEFYNSPTIVIVNKGIVKGFANRNNFEPVKMSEIFSLVKDNWID